ncbi:hypothetical protein LCL95_08585 [Bacillus timonensis]|nr:hypothetical protein [Bacillus timonensis]
MALNKNGSYFSLLEERSLDELREMRSSQTFFCPICRQTVSLKLGEKKSYHFSHVKGSDCLANFEAESDYHLKGKKQLYEWVKSSGNEVKVEAYMKEIHQRPDLLMRNKNGQLIAIEFQCSQISMDTFMKRNESYRNASITPIWILGGNWLKQTSEHTLKLTPFQWMFSHHSSRQRDPSIYYFCPRKRKISIVHSPIPFNSSNVFASIIHSTTQHITINQVIQNQFSPLMRKDFGEVWLNQRSKWRMNFSMYPQKKHKRLLTALYEHSIFPSLLPVEAGIPTTSSYWFHSPPTIWQMWILLDSILPNVNQTISFQHVFQRVKERVKKKQIEIRKLPLLTETHYSFAIMEYLHVLCKLLILKKVNKTTFKIISSITIPRNEEEAMKHDYSLLEKLNE